jgi:hypothetical protein
MCTMGCVIDAGSVLTFKQCDLPAPTRFLAPVVEVGPGGIRYLGFHREGATGPWAGVNEHGVAFVATDAYLLPEAREELDPGGDLLSGYARILAEHRSAASAVAPMIAFYEERRAPDILLLSDPEGAFLVEFSPFAGARVRRCTEGHVVSTNHFRMLPDAVEYQDDPSTYLRLGRAEEILGADPSLGGIRAVLRDQQFGESERSICRVAEAAGEYATQAAVIFRVGRGRVDGSWLLHGNPRTGVFEEAEDLFRVR